MAIIKNLCLVLLPLLPFACTNSNNNTNNVKELSSNGNVVKGTYGYDAAFLKNYLTHIVELENGNVKILLSTDYQGRVMTSTASGDRGTSYGWINYNLISSGQKKKQFNPIGGEERFWLGPEGGQYSIYFNKADSFNVAHWQVPPIVDTETYDALQSNKSSATFSKSAVITNYSGSVFHFDITRKNSVAR